VNSKTILRNTLWYGLENLISFLASLITSVLVARALGPSRMGYIIYVMWMANIASSFGSIGIPATTRKYMAEYLGSGQQSTARFIYFRTLYIQIGMATVMTGASIIWVLRSAPAEFRLAALLLVIGVWPSMVNFISAQANVASEDLSSNLPASAASTATFFVLTVVAVYLHWGVVGIASAMLGMRVVDFAVRFIPTLWKVRGWPTDNVSIPPDLRPRMFHFAWQSITGMMLTLIVWDRSEIFLLKHMSPDVRQIAFYSVAFSLAEKLLIFPTVFASATGATVFAQYGRDRTRIPAMTAASARYLGLTSLPLHIVTTALAGSLLVAMYGDQYRGAILVATMAPLTCLPKAFLTPVQTLFEAIERQKYFIWATLFASAVDVAVAWWLIPQHGAVGATIGSGVAQLIAVTALWALAITRYRIRLPWLFLGKVTIGSTFAAGCAYAVARSLPPLPGLLAGAGVAGTLLLGCAWLFRWLEREDLERLKVLVDASPSVLAAPVQMTYSWLLRRVTIVEELP
jgi:O-antigen/teichoic acid export membrane protein